MSIKDHKALEQAIEITKSFCLGGKTGDPSSVLENTYRKLKELQKDAGGYDEAENVPPLG